MCEFTNRVAIIVRWQSLLVSKTDPIRYPSVKKLIGA